MGCPGLRKKTALRLTAVALCILLSAAGTAAFRLYELWCDLPDVNALLEQAAVRREAMPRTLSLAFLALEDTAFLQRENGENSPIVRHLARWLLRSGERDADYLLKRSLLAWKLEYHLSRDDILTLYLNHIYLGGHSVGVNSAARFYFGINTAALSTGQCALLAGLARCPASCSPLRHPGRAKTRQMAVLDALRRLGWITSPEYARAATEPMTHSASPIEGWPTAERPE